MSQICACFDKNYHHAHISEDPEACALELRFVFPNYFIVTKFLVLAGQLHSLERASFEKVEEKILTFLFFLTHT